MNIESLQLHVRLGVVERLTLSFTPPHASCNSAEIWVRAAGLTDDGRVVGLLPEAKLPQLLHQIFIHVTNHQRLALRRREAHELQLLLTPPSRRSSEGGGDQILTCLPGGAREAGRI